MSIETTDGHALIRLRRRDMRDEARFHEYYGAAIGPEVVAMFLPNWRGLAWRRVPAHLLSRGEILVEDGDYQVTVVPLSGWDTADHEHAMRAFDIFMRGNVDPGPSLWHRMLSAWGRRAGRRGA